MKELTLDDFCCPDFNQNRTTFVTIGHYPILTSFFFPFSSPFAHRQSKKNFIQALNWKSGLTAIEREEKEREKGIGERESLYIVKGKNKEKTSVYGRCRRGLVAPLVTSFVAETANTKQRRQREPRANDPFEHRSWYTDQNKGHWAHLHSHRYHLSSDWTTILCFNICLPWCYLVHRLACHQNRSPTSSVNTRFLFLHSRRRSTHFTFLRHFVATELCPYMRRNIAAHPQPVIKNLSKCVERRQLKKQLEKVGKINWQHNFILVWNVIRFTTITSIIPTTLITRLTILDEVNHSVHQGEQTFPTFIAPTVYWFCVCLCWLAVTKSSPDVIGWQHLLSDNASPPILIRFAKVPSSRTFASSYLSDPSIDSKIALDTRLKQSWDVLVFLIFGARDRRKCFGFLRSKYYLKKCLFKIITTNLMAADFGANIFSWNAFRDAFLHPNRRKWSECLWSICMLVFVARRA